MLRIHHIAAAFCSVALLPAQSALTGPMGGFVFDPPTRSLRPLIGSTASAWLGDALLAGLGYASAAPGKDYALALAGERWIVVSGLGSGAVTTADLADVAAGEAAWSGDGGTAVIFSRADNRLQVVRGFPAEPRAESVVSLASLGSALSAVAVDFRGAQIAIGIEGDNGGVYRLSGDGGFVPLAQIGKPAIAFSPDGSVLYALDRSAGALWEIRADGSTLEWGTEALAGASALRPAEDASGRSVLYLASSGARALEIYDAASREAIAHLALDFEPVGIEPLARNGFVLRPRASTDEPLWRLITDPALEVRFVPAAPAAPGESGQ